MSVQAQWNLDYSLESVVKVAMRTAKPTLITLIGVIVGFADDGYGAQLSWSLAGAQFLGLATVLVTTIDSYQGGLILEILLRSSCSDTTLLPTAR